MSTRLLLIPAHLLLLLINCQCRQIHLTVLRSADGDEGVTVSYWQANATLRVDHTKANRRAPSNLIQNAPVRASPATALASFNLSSAFVPCVMSAAHGAQDSAGTMCLPTRG